MANTIVKVGQIVEAAVLLLERELVLPRLVWRQSDADFVGALNDTITLRVPAKRTAGRRTMRSLVALSPVDLTETSVPVQLTDHVYDLLKVTDEELTLDIVDFTRQILTPQMRAVAEGLEDVVAEALVAANIDQEVPFHGNVDDPYDIAVDAAKALNELDVPRSERFLVLGSDVEAAFLKSDRLSKVNESGSESALRDARITRVAGFDVFGSNALAADEAFAFHRTAIANAIVAPALPEGATAKARVSLDGLALRFLRDYDPTNSTGPVDRTLVDAFTGAASVEEDGNNKRAVRIAYWDSGS